MCSSCLCVYKLGLEAQLMLPDVEPKHRQLAPDSSTTARQGQWKMIRGHSVEPQVKWEQAKASLCQHLLPQVDMHVKYKER